MGWYKLTKFICDAFRSSRIIPNTNPIQKSIFRYPNQSKGNIFQLNKLNNGFLNQNKVNPFVVNGRRRFYCVDKRQVYPFRPRGHKKWLENPMNVFVVGVCSVVVVILYFGDLETVPYTKRKHFLLFSNLETQLSQKRFNEKQFNETKHQFEGKILPATHPDSVRVRLITKNIIESLQKGLSKEQVWSNVGYTSGGDFESNETSGDGSLKALSNERVEGTWSKADGILDGKWVQQSRKKGQEKGEVPATGHLDWSNWEVLVVSEPVVKAFCMPGGKIVVFTGLLEHFRSDAEIATIIGHEVAHEVARHAHERMTKMLWFGIVYMVLLVPLGIITKTPHESIASAILIATMIHLFLTLPLLRRMEMEADYIGLLLIASAGYDPRVAPSVYEKKDKVTRRDSTLPDYLSNNPSGKKRAQLLAQAKVMEEALLIYRKILSEKGVEGFL